MLSLPERVIEAVRKLNEDHHDQTTVAWEQGTSAIVVFDWDSTRVMRYVLSADLSTVLVAEQVRNPKKGLRWPG